MSKPDIPEKPVSPSEPERSPEPAPSFSETEQPDTEQTIQQKGNLLELLERENQGNWEILESPVSEPIGG